MKIQAWVFILLTGLGAAACDAHKPAYSNINLNQSSAINNQSVPDSAQNSASSPPPQTPPASTAIRVPAFMDPRKTEAKDLPNYPGARSTNIQYGPLGESEMFTASLLSSDSTDKIAAFYDKVVKSNGWTATNRIVDPDYCEWELKKNQSDVGHVIVKKDQQPNHFIITIVRTGTPSVPSTPPKS